LSPSPNIARLTKLVLQQRMLSKSRANFGNNSEFRHHLGKQGATKVVNWHKTSREQRATALICYKIWLALP